MRIRTLGSHSCELEPGRELLLAQFGAVLDELGRVGDLRREGRGHEHLREQGVGIEREGREQLVELLIGEKHRFRQDFTRVGDATLVRQMIVDRPAKRVVAVLGNCGVATEHGEHGQGGGHRSHVSPLRGSSSLDVIDV